MVEGKKGLLVLQHDVSDCGTKSDTQSDSSLIKGNVEGNKKGVFTLQ